MKRSNNHKNESSQTATVVRLLCLVLAFLMVGGGLTGLISFLLNS